TAHVLPRSPSLHDALPIYGRRDETAGLRRGGSGAVSVMGSQEASIPPWNRRDGLVGALATWRPQQAVPGDRLAGFRQARHLDDRSEEHTSELQSPDHLVCR